MKPKENVKIVLIASFFTVVLLALSGQAQADWSGAEVHANALPALRVVSQYRIQPAQPQQYAPVVTSTQPDRQNQPAEHRQDRDRDRHGYYRYDNDNFAYRAVGPVVVVNRIVTVNPVVPVIPATAVPDRFETVDVNGETYYYNNGFFYQLIDDQLTAVPASLGAVVSSVPQGCQIVVADGVNYFVWGGIYYKQMDQGFEVVEPPQLNQE